MVSIFTRSTLAVLLAAPAVLFAVESPPLTLAGAVQLAVSQSRLVDAGNLQASSSREMAVAASQLPDPVLKLGINNLPINGEDRFSLTRDFMTMRSVGVMQEFTREDKRRARTLRFEREAETAEANRSLNSISIRRSTALAWLDRYYQERMVELLQGMRGETTMLLVEHDMNAVFRLADRISTLVYGKVIACGTPDEIRAHPEVRSAYLGDLEEASP